MLNLKSTNTSLSNVYEENNFTPCSAKQCFSFGVNRGFTEITIYCYKKDDDEINMQSIPKTSKCFDRVS